MNNILNDLVDISREYGADPQWVVAGGGNTSLKVDDVLYVKASGYPLATIDEGGFARMDRSKLAAIWSTDYPSGEDKAAVAERERIEAITRVLYPSDDVEAAVGGFSALRGARFFFVVAFRATFFLATFFLATFFFLWGFPQVMVDLLYSVVPVFVGQAYHVLQSETKKLRVPVQPSPQQPGHQYRQ